MEIVSFFSTSETLTNQADSIRSAKRMYYPQAYHHIQEIQKYNIQDYRPRYVLFSNILSIQPPNHILIFSLSIEWSNSKKQSEKCAKSNACVNNAAMPSHKPMNPKLGSYKLTIRRGREEGMVRWLVRGRRLEAKKLAWSALVGCFEFFFFYNQNQNLAVCTSEYTG